MLSRRALTAAALLARAGDPLAVSGPLQLLLSDIGFMAAPDDTLYPNRYFDGRVLEPLNIEYGIPFTPNAARRSSAAVGDIVIINADGALDERFASAVDGRPVKVLMGRPGQDLGDFEPVFVGSSAAWRDGDEHRVAIGLRGALWQLDVPMNRPLYQGTGTGGGVAEGGADIKGKFKPALFGIGRDISPVLVDAALGIYQFHFRQAQQVIRVCDGGAPYTPAGDVADITVASVAPGTFKTQLSAGLFRVGTLPAKTLTLDARGDAPGGLYVERAADIVFRLLHDIQGLDDGQFEYTTFDALNLAAPGAIGLYLGLDAVSAAAVVDQAMAGIFGWWGENRLGRIELGLVALPRAMPRATLTMDDLMEFQRVALPDDVEPAYWRVTVGYGRNWTPLDQTQIATSIVTGDAARLAFLTQEYRYCAPVEEILIKTKHPAARELVLFSAYDAEADAAALAQRIFAMFSVQRRLARIRTKLQGFRLSLGDTVALDFPRYGLSGGRNVVVVGQGLMGSSFDSTLTVFW